MAQFENPVGLDGVEFVEYSGPDKKQLENLFTNFGFTKVGSHKNKDIDLYRQGDMTFLINMAPDSFASKFASVHGPSISSVGFRVKSKGNAFEVATSRGAIAYEGQDKLFETYPSVRGIGDSLIYFVEDYARPEVYQSEFTFNVEDWQKQGKGFVMVDHFTNNVPVGEMQKWCDFYEKVFNFREIKYFDIKGDKTGLISKVMKAPDDKIIIPINEPTDEKSQIQEYINEYKGSGIQHLALLTPDIMNSVREVRESGVNFLDVPDTYYEMIPDRLPNVEEPLGRLKDLRILVDGDDEGYLLQIFTQNIIGPIFFEVIQRKNHDGFGEGNFQALFDAIERDQERRGVL